MTSRTSFQRYRKPVAARIELSRRTKGIPPSRVPAGHMYLQNQTSPSPVKSIMNNGNRMTRSPSMMNLNHLSPFSPGSRCILPTKGILNSRSCTRPKGHRKPQINLPSRVPNTTRNPRTYSAALKLWFPSAP